MTHFIYEDEIGELLLLHCDLYPRVQRIVNINLNFHVDMIMNLNLFS